MCILVFAGVEPRADMAPALTPAESDGTDSNANVGPTSSTDAIANSALLPSEHPMIERLTPDSATFDRQPSSSSAQELTPLQLAGQILMAASGNVGSWPHVECAPHFNLAKHSTNITGPAYRACARLTDRGRLSICCPVVQP